MFGISPIVYAYITQWMYTFVNELHLMPIMVLACKMSPKSVEASFYAFILAVINLGYLLSYQLGGLLTYSLGITATDFTNLWILIVIATVFPLVTLLFLLMLPNEYDVNEEIDKYFTLKKKSKSDLKSDINKNGDTVSRDSFIRVKTNIRDDIGEGEYLIDID